MMRVTQELHGLRKSPEYTVWRSMINRCSSSKSSRWNRYGGRGITVCDRWRNSFLAFYQDMGPRPTLRHSINRINNDQSYEPDNCEWATMSQQNSNKGLQGNNTSGYRGVHLDRKVGRWIAYVGVDGQRICVRGFGTAEEAAYVRDQFALVLHGPNAYLNVL